MADFRQLSDSVLASPQIEVGDIATAKDLGVTMVVNNRPEGEADDQTPGAEIEAAARAAGMDYVAIPIGRTGYSAPQIEAMVDALHKTDGKVLAYCRSGTRSTLLWSLAQAQQGANPDAIAEAAADAGYDISPIRPMVDMLASQSGDT